MQTRWLLALFVFGAANAPARADSRSVPFCQILDRADNPAWEVQADYVNRASVEAPEGHSFSALRLHGGGGLFFSDAPAGSVELGGAYTIQNSQGDGGIGIPDNVVDAHLDAVYLWRSWDGRSLRLRAQPGLYGEPDGLNAKSFRVPFEVTGIQALSPRLSGLLGVFIYPGFSRPFDPRFGIRYALADDWSLDLQYPESRLLWRDPSGTEAYLLIRNDPINEFWLDSDDARASYRFEETRIAAGWALPLVTELRLRVEVGYLFNRSVDFARGAPARAVEDAVIVGAGIGGPL